MDFVIAGLAAGAGLAICGFLLRELGMSQRVRIASWIAEAGLALMGAALISWALTAVSLATGQEDSRAGTVVGAGTIISTLLLLAIAAIAGRRRRRPVSETVIPEARPYVESPESQEREDSLEAPDLGASTTLTDENSGDSDPTTSPELPQDRQPPDWEEIWRETWGSEPLPRAVSAHTAQPATIAPEENDSDRTTWGASESVDDDPVAPDDVLAEAGDRKSAAE